VSIENAAGDVLENNSTPSMPTPADVSVLRTRVADMVRRALNRMKAELETTVMTSTPVAAPPRAPGR
jgi:hypothetical protein